MNCDTGSGEVVSSCESAEDGEDDEEDDATVNWRLVASLENDRASNPSTCSSNMRSSSAANVRRKQFFR
jgi:hypothetical protein